MAEKRKASTPKATRGRTIRLNPGDKVRVQGRVLRVPARRAPGRKR